MQSIIAKKRFYKDVSLVDAGNGSYEILLDSKKLKTPGGAVFSVESEPLALAVAHEWESQKDQVLLSQMHLTGINKFISITKLILMGKFKAPFFTSTEILNNI